MTAAVVAAVVNRSQFCPTRTDIRKPTTTEKAKRNAVWNQWTDAWYVTISSATSSRIPYDRR
jgi:hypothetical protein